MQFRIPPQHKETVSVVRRSAYESSAEMLIAENVVCMLTPRTDNMHRRDAVNLVSGVPIGESDWTALLEKPNLEMTKGDFMRHSDGSELRIEAVIGMTGSAVMQLHLKYMGVL